MTRDALRIATRGSRLALWQAEYVRDALLAAGVAAVELVEVVSQGDADRIQPLRDLGTVGVFTKAVQDAVLEGRADIAVHSLKDLPTEPHPRLTIAAVPQRGRTEDVLLAPRHRTLRDLPENAVVATGSLRRQAQILLHRPDLSVRDVRGNVETRIRRLHEEPLDAMVLAYAGLQRLGLTEHVTQTLEPPLMLPAVGQGALGIECRSDDDEVLELLAALDDPASRAAVTAERGLLHRLRGGCSVPVGAAGKVMDGNIELTAIVLTADGARHCTGTLSGPVADAAGVGRRLAEQLIADGADDILREFRS